jgi:hypothetical protein
VPRIKRTKIPMNRCPECGHHDGDGFTFQEVGTRVCWQPVKLGFQRVRIPGSDRFDDTAFRKTPRIDTVDYREYDTSDDVEVNYYECLGCESSWPNLAFLRAAQVAAWQARRAGAGT